LLEEHRRVLRAAFKHHGGVEVDTQGELLDLGWHRLKDVAESGSTS
jgi:hypothetical protein